MKRVTNFAANVIVFAGFFYLGWIVRDFKAITEQRYSDMLANQAVAYDLVGIKYPANHEEALKIIAETGQEIRFQFSPYQPANGVDAYPSQQFTRYHKNFYVGVVGERMCGSMFKNVRFEFYEFKGGNWVTSTIVPLGDLNFKNTDGVVEVPIGEKTLILTYYHKSKCSGQLLNVSVK